MTANLTPRPETGDRGAGILLHPTALPSRHGIGDLGPDADRFVDLLRRARQRYWQILPLGPVGTNGSPYNGTSAFAGNPLLISPDRLVEAGLIDPDGLPDAPAGRADRVDFEAVFAFKNEVIDRAWQRFESVATPGQRTALAGYVDRQAGWLPDYALFEALREAHERRAWFEWPADLAGRDPAALDRAKADLAGRIAYHQFAQWLFDDQWQTVRQAANQIGIRMIGDLPIFLAHDSADVWASQQLFKLEPDGRLIVQSGVPPDAFSETGQLWGNPLYRWDAHAAEGYAWWIARYRVVFGLVDVLRIDHFRGFEASWEVPAGAETAETGRWVPGPGPALFDAVSAELGRLPIIVEDLGLITPEVRALRDQLGYPGMKVLQFAFDSDARNPYLPHNHERGYVVYPGTHDNDTAIGWFAARPPGVRQAVLDYLGTPDTEINWDLIRLAWASVANTAIAPLQDVIGLDSEARFNRPGQGDGNWAWRFTWDQLPDAAIDRLAKLTEIYGRAGG